MAPQKEIVTAIRLGLQKEIETAAQMVIPMVSRKATPKEMLRVQRTESSMELSSVHRLVPN
jgi:hypothetical protein